MTVAFVSSCRRDCRVANRVAKVGYVRLCEHGRLWSYQCPKRGVGYWCRIYWWSNPVLYRRAARAIEAAERAP